MWYNQPDPNEYFMLTALWKERVCKTLGTSIIYNSISPPSLPVCVTGLINGGKISYKCGRERIFYPTVTVKGHADIMSFRLNFSSNNFNNWRFRSIYC